MTPFTLQPTDLIGNKIRLLPLKYEHFEGLFAVAADPLLWAQHPNPNRYQRDVFENYFEGVAVGFTSMMLQLPLF
jgi:hypothetical protein